MQLLENAAYKETHHNPIKEKRGRRNDSILIAQILFKKKNLDLRINTWQKYTKIKLCMTIICKQNIWALAKWPNKWGNTIKETQNSSKNMKRVNKVKILSMLNKRVHDFITKTKSFTTKLHHSPVWHWKI